MAAAAAEQEEMDYSTPDLPWEILEKILLNLPIKSLIVFTSVSTSWKSKIHSLISAAELRKILVINDNPSYFDVWNASTAPLSVVSKNLPLGRTTASDLVCPFQAEAQLKAFCDELWFVVDQNSLYLWNPSTGVYKELEDMPPDPRPNAKAFEVVYGLGYDPADDDFKLLRIFRFNGEGVRSSLYSLKSGSWKVITRELWSPLFPDCNGLFVNRALHWMASNKSTSMPELVSFDFSTEGFRVLRQPEYEPKPKLGNDFVDVAVLRGKLCVFLNYRQSLRDTSFVLWAMEDYGVVESWTKLYEIIHKSIHPTLLTPSPLYVYEDGRVVIWACSGYKESCILVYKDGGVVGYSEIVAPNLRTRTIDLDEGGSSTSVQGGFIDPDAGSSSGSVQNGFIDPGRATRRVRGGFMYIESLVSPKKWVQGNSNPGFKEKRGSILCR